MGHIGAIVGGVSSVPHANIQATPAAAPSSVEHKSVLEWTARVQAKKFELGGSYTVLFFLGPVPEDPKDWRTAPSYIGAHFAFANSVASGCENCRNHSEMVSESYIGLNIALEARPDITSFDPEHVDPYLQANLRHRVQKVSLVLSGRHDCILTMYFRSPAKSAKCCSLSKSLSLVHRLS